VATPSSRPIEAAQRSPPSVHGSCRATSHHPLDIPILLEVKELTRGQSRDLELFSFSLTTAQPWHRLVYVEY
jgi:hypothetical protein